VRHFDEVAIDMSAFQREFTPGYFNNEGQVRAPWELFRGYGPGLRAFTQLLQGWREKGDLSGLKQRSLPIFFVNRSDIE